MKTGCILLLSIVVLLNFGFGQSTDVEPGLNEMIFADVEPRPLNMIEVQKLIGYPAEAKQKRIQGNVAVRVLVGKSGNYIKHTLLTEAPPILVKAVEKHISKLEFSPAELGGEHIMFWVNIPFSFKLISDPKVYRAAEEEPYRKPKKYRKNTFLMILGIISLIISLTSLR